MPQSRSPRLYYIENLRIVLSTMVILVHLACSYGGIGGWAYTERGAGLGSILPLTLFNATGQSFFMGMFFFISAYFTHRSFQKKGFWPFIKDRFIRLVIPLLLTMYFISPLVSSITWPIKSEKFADFSFLDVWQTGLAFGFGVMWFVRTLLMFTFLYLIARILFPGLRKTESSPMPKIKFRQILITSLILGVLTFAVRIIYPLFTHSHRNVLNIETGHYVQYIFLFVLGVITAKYDSDYFVSYIQAKKWMWLSLVMIFIAFPILFFLGGASEGFRPYFGGLSWQSAAYSIWEQLTGIAIMVALMGITKTKWNTQSKFTTHLSNSAYAVYVLHPPILVWISIAFMNWKAMHLIKFLALAPLAVAASFAIAILIKKIPVLKRIF
jgi:hypothetical protein